MLKSMYKIMYHRHINAPSGSQLYSHVLDYYPEEIELRNYLEVAPNGYVHVSVERVYALA